MSSQRKAEAVASENIVTTETSRLSDLWKKEDWLAVWIGFIIIAIGAVAVLTGAFDFNAAKFSTWGHGTSFFEQVNAGFFGKLLLTVAVLGVLFTVGNHLKGLSVKKYLPAFLGLFLLAVLVRFISAEYTLNRTWNGHFCNPDRNSGIQHHRSTGMAEAGDPDRILYQSRTGDHGIFRTVFQYC